MRRILGLVGALVLTAAVAAPALAEGEEINYVTISGATVDRGGVVHVVGTVWCSVPMGVHFDGSVAQTVGRKATVWGGFGGDMWCNGVTPWESWSRADQGKFVAGWANIDVGFQGAWVCDDQGNCWPTVGNGAGSYLKITRAR